MIRTESTLAWMQIRSCHVVEFLLKNSKHLKIDYIIFILKDCLNTKIIYTRNYVSSAMFVFL